MANASEAAFAKTPQGSDLATGVETLSLDQEITFAQYRRLVLPLDGYVFWVKALTMLPSAMANSSAPNVLRPNRAPSSTSSAETFIVKGSLHYATDIRQEEAETYAANRVIFTAEDEVNPLNNIAPGTLWIGTFAELGDQKFAFSSQTSRYQQAGLWHYVGFAVYPDMQTQIVDDPAHFDSMSVIVSNSLPAWLGMNYYAPAYGFALPKGLTLFPSFLVPQNEAPPFAAVHIGEDDTEAWAMAPTLYPNSTHAQLCRDRVKVTIWGERNSAAMDFVDAVNQYSLDTNAFGIVGELPVIRDEKRTQEELATIAMKKSITFEVSYLQTRINSIGRGIIKKAAVALYPRPNP